jgi:uncharacterized repeat protein (TIGR02543 family)
MKKMKMKMKMKLKMKMKMKMKKEIMFLAAALIMAALVLTGCETPVDVGSVICTVRFSLEGGSFDDNEEDPPQPLSLTVNSGASVGLLPMKLEKDGYIFGGWYTERNGGGTLVTARTTVSGSITVYAKWIGKYTVKFRANEGIGTTPDDQTVYAGSGITLPGGDGLSRTGYTFGGWNTNSAGTGTNYSAGASYTPTSSITLYAKWTAMPYTVTFDADGGNYTPQPLTVDYNALVGEANMPAAPTKTSYSFGGWYTVRGGGGIEFNADSRVTDTITVFAKWTPTGTITVTFTGLPEDENIDLSDDQVLSWRNNDPLEVNVSGDYSAYRLALDGPPVIASGVPPYTLTLYAGDLSVKQHTLTVFVTKSGVEYTKRVTFTVIP